MSNFWLSVLPALLVVAAYVGLGLDRLNHHQALALTTLGTLALLLLPQIGAPIEPAGAAVIVTALIAGHLGWLIGRLRHPARRQMADEDPPTRHRPDDRASTAAPDPTVEVSAAPASVTLRIPPDRPSEAAPGGKSPAAQPLQPTPPTPAPASAARGGVAIADLSRTSLGRYRIDRVIGRGSMGVVYQGLDPMLGRRVAIKTMALGREFDGSELDEARQRFFREAETAGRLQHRDIVTIYDVGEEQELAYIAMEFLKGQDLQRHTSPGKLLPVPVVSRIGMRVAEALAYAHTRGVVHRDVKPANVMLHLPTGAIKVTDFGIARVTDASRTRTGTVLGTPSFMSPEHLSGLRTDGRSDLYSLGVMLYQLLTGQLPFQADSMAKLMYRITNDPAPDVRTVRPDLPEELASVLARALQKDPADRHADGMQMAAALRAVDPGRTGPIAAVAAPEAGASADAFAATVRQLR